MYAVIKTGGKQYRVQAGDLLVVEKLEGEPGAAVAFGEVLMLGEGEAVTVGAPTVDGAVVSGTLIETRKGEKVKIFKKIRRQGYRRTRGHRQLESVVRVTSVAGAGKEAKWEGSIDLTPKVILDARARGLGDAAVPFSVPAAAEAAPAPKKAKAPKAEAAAEPAAEAAPKKKAAPKKAAKTEDGEA
ncbi:50S ribosomal protein L21 [Caulobacter sp. CCH9-E1]|jgi:large subunit ribosomal protein L21|uniref:50S ribosomal protein L21 n=1 Tax=Caulobacter sp. CCH9-E1 TaxID=1768768 RepID=UPI0008326B15|nr:50S ribosomal protein L21 [Caulobacter sp. CCH9-E1]